MCKAWRRGAEVSRAQSLEARPPRCGGPARGPAWSRTAPPTPWTGAPTRGGPGPRGCGKLQQRQAQTNSYRVAPRQELKRTIPAPASLPPPPPPLENGDCSWCIAGRGGGTAVRRAAGKGASTSGAERAAHPSSSTNTVTTRKPAVSAPIISRGKSLGGGRGPMSNVRSVSNLPDTVTRRAGTSPLFS